MSLFQRLPAGKYEHRIICVQIRDAAFADKIRSYGIEITETGPVQSVLSPKRYLQAVKIIREWKPDICHGAVIEGYTLAAVAGWIAGGTQTILEETSCPINRSWRGNLLTRLAARLSDQCIAPSEAVSDYLVNHAGVNRKKIAVVHNGVEHPIKTLIDRAAIKARYGLPDTAPVIGSVGRIVHDKGFDVLIKTLSDPRLKKCWLLVVGEGPDKAKLQTLAESLGVGDRVIWAGFHQDTGPLYAAMDVFALATRQEAFGMVNVEAMWCGVPVVATRVGGIPEVVVPEVTGLLVAKDDVAGFADALSSIITDSSKCVRLGKAGKNRAKEKFSASVYARRIDEFYTVLAH